MADVERLPTASPSLVVASYNVHRCIGHDGRHDPERVARVIAELDADVLGLQEVTARVDEDGGVDQLACLAGAGYAAVAGPTQPLDRGHCGNALLVRGKVLGYRRLDLSVPRTEARGALDVELECRGMRLRAVVTHLGLARRARLSQAVRLLAALGDDRRQPLVVLGDVNEWLPMGVVLRLFHARLGRTAGPATFPARRPVFALDRIWVQPARALTALGAHATPLARAASDHLPVRAMLLFPAAVAAERPDLGAATASPSPDPLSHAAR
jgi:endonuclease/exonuclease/phosphatase family metal-dependent hydrolase